MAKDQGKKRYKDPYRLVLLRDETLEEVGSYKLSPLNVYMLISSILVITSIIVVLLVFFTPLRHLVPGYADITQNRAYMTLYNDIQDLESQVEAQQLYIQRFRSIVIGDSAVGGNTLSPAAKEIFNNLPENGSPAVLEVAAAKVKSNVDELGIDFLYINPPLSGSISHVFNPKTGHLGVDVVAPKNTPIQAILDGHIIASDWTLETGNTIGIQHANNLVSFYKHNARNLKDLGSFVKAGEAVAIIGNTGELSSGPHLHFELWVEGKPVDPVQFVDFQ